MKYMLLIVAMSLNVCFGQSLGKKRVEVLRNSVVRLLVGNNSIGTAFIVDNEGILVTCWHVAINAFPTGNVDNKLPLFAEFQNGEKIEVEILNSFLTNTKKQTHAVSYDYCLLRFINKPKTKFRSLRIGDFSKVNDGDMVYTAGYPLGIAQQFISTGNLSTKYINVDSIITPNGKIHVNRDAALIDMSMNPGNSGGPILVVRDKPENDIVIGIADFIITPAGKKIHDIYYKASIISRGASITVGIGDSEYSEFEAVRDIAGVLSQISVGISGCISINYVKPLISR